MVNETSYIYHSHQVKILKQPCVHTFFISNVQNLVFFLYVKQRPEHLTQIFSHSRSDHTCVIKIIKVYINCQNIDLNYVCQSQMKEGF